MADSNCKLVNETKKTAADRIDRRYAVSRGFRMRRWPSSTLSSSYSEVAEFFPRFEFSRNWSSEGVFASSSKSCCHVMNSFQNSSIFINSAHLKGRMPSL